MDASQRPAFVLWAQSNAIVVDLRADVADVHEVPSPVDFGRCLRRGRRGRHPQRVGGALEARSDEAPAWPAGHVKMTVSETLGVDVHVNTAPDPEAKEGCEKTVGFQSQEDSVLRIYIYTEKGLPALSQEGEHGLAGPRVLLAKLLAVPLVLLERPDVHLRDGDREEDGG